MIKQCEFCGKQFKVKDTVHGMRKRFCNASCSAKWRTQKYGVAKKSEDGKKRLSVLMKSRWEDKDFRDSVISRMYTDNPSFNRDNIEKAKRTKLQRGYVPNNNFKYGNGKLSEYESKVYDKLINCGFYYNYAINTKLARDAFPSKHYAHNYKPDFTNISKHLCIEIDGKNHKEKSVRELDKKKDECLEFLGFTVMRFTHNDIDEGRFDKWLNSYQKDN